MPQEAKDKLSSLLGKDYDSIVTNSPMGVGRTNLFKMDILTTGYPSIQTIHNSNQIPKILRLGNMVIM